MGELSYHWASQENKFQSVQGSRKSVEIINCFSKTAISDAFMRKLKNSNIKKNRLKKMLGLVGIYNVILWELQYISIIWPD